MTFLSRASMALSLDDKILGEKTHYYCSSSEEDDDDEREPVAAKGPQFIPESELEENTNNGGTYAAVNVSFNQVKWPLL